jgi:hypothetical protein
VLFDKFLAFRGYFITHDEPWQFPRNYHTRESAIVRAARLVSLECLVFRVFNSGESAAAVSPLGDRATCVCSMFMSFFIHKKFVSVKSIILTTQFHVVIASNSRMLKRCMNICYVIGYERATSPLFQCMFYSVITDNILMWNYKVSIMSKGDCLRLTLCACYSWEMAIQVGLDASFDNMWDDTEADEVNSTKNDM